jgi:hypothetical protein
MSTYKNTSGDLTLTGDAGAATLTINYANTIFNGSLTYTGNLTTVDDFIVVAANNTGTITEMGLLGQTGPTTFAGLRFNTVANAWQISTSVTSTGAPVVSYSNIATAATTAVPGGPDTAIQFNQGNAFSGTANLRFDYGNNRLTLTGVQYLGYQSVPPNVANTVAIFSNTIGSGGTGLYFTSNSANDELVSKSAAIVFSIIF